MKTQIEFFQEKMGINVQSIITIYGGLNSHNYLINNEFVLRMKLPIIDTFYQPSFEVQVEQAVQNQGLSTQLLFFDERFGHKVTRYVPHVTHFDKDHLHQQWPCIITHLEQLHRLSFEHHAFEGHKRLLAYQSISKAAPLIINQEKFLNEITIIEAKYPKVLSHNDLVQGNMLFQGDRAWIIDFEYAGENSFLFDYFSFISENKITNERDLDWTENLYFSKAKKLSRLEFKTYHAYLDLLWYYWAKAMHHQTSLPIYEWIAGDKRLSFFNHYQPSK
jgi:thiamine kinase-like enzyme